MAKFIARLAALAALTLVHVSAGAAEDFFAGKRLTFVISTGPGGGIDSYARVLIDHYARHIPGNPTIVAQNMPGAGGMTATRFLYNNAPRDGTAMGLVHSSMIDVALFHVANPGFEIARVNWIGNLGSNPSLCIAWESSPVRRFEDLRDHAFVVGSAGAFSGSEVNPRVLNELLGTRIKIVSGYESGSAIDLAMERGEIEGRCATSTETIRTSHPEWLANHRIRFLVQMGLSRDPALPEVPSVAELVPDAKAKGVIEALFGRREMQRPIFAPPDVPAERIAVLRRAFDETVRDPAFLAEAKRRGLDITPLTGEQCEALVKRIYAQPPDIIDAAKKLFAEEQ